MNARRVVEEFGSTTWIPEQDGRRCVFNQVKVNGEDERFTFEQPFSNTSLVPLKSALGRQPSPSELAALAKAIITDSVSAGKLDGWLPSVPVVLGSVHYTEVDFWVRKAGL